jgi:hypothetical protein
VSYPKHRSHLPSALASRNTNGIGFEFAGTSFKCSKSLTKQVEDLGVALTYSFGLDLQSIALGHHQSPCIHIDFCSRSWAVLGAFVLIFSLAFDPFLQASVSFVGKLDNITAGNNIPALGRSEYLNMGQILRPPPAQAIGRMEDGLVVDFYANSGFLPDFGISSAVFRGFYNSSTTSNQSTAFTCSTGNCTWPIFTSMAFCSSCNDVSAQITKKSGIGWENATDQYVPKNMKFKADYTSYDLSYSHIKSLNGPRFKDSNNEGFFNTLLTANSTSDFRDTISFQKLNTLLISFTIMRAGPSFLSNESSWEDSTPIAMECALYLCANAYNASVERSRLTEQILGSWAIREPGSWKSSDWFRPTGEDGDYEKWDEKHPSLSHQMSDHAMFRTDLQLSIPQDQLAKLAPNLTDKFNITQGTIASTQKFLLDWIPSPNKLIVYPIYHNKNQHSPLAQVLWSSTNITTTFDNVAQSLTRHVRDTSGTTQTGIAKQWVIHFRMNWSFLALPIITVTLGCLYFSLILIYTARLGLPAWKESAMPTLAYGFDWKAQALLKSADLHPLPAAQTLAKKLMIRFNDNGDGDGFKLHPA